MVKIKLVPKEVTLTQSRLEYNIIGMSQDNQSFTVYYRLTEDDGWLITEGNQQLPIQALSAIASGTLDIEALNQVIAGFGIQALEDQSEPTPQATVPEPQPEEEGEPEAGE
jgi:hypothetical protein